MIEDRAAMNTKSINYSMILQQNISQTYRKKRTLKTQEAFRTPTDMTREEHVIVKRSNI